MRSNRLGRTKNILITGAEGVIGSILRRHLADRYRLRLLSRVPMDVPSHVADVADLAALRPAFDGIDSVVHLAAAADVDAPWDEVLAANIVSDNPRAFWSLAAARRILGYEPQDSPPLSDAI